MIYVLFILAVGLVLFLYNHLHVAIHYRFLRLEAFLGMKSAFELYDKRDRDLFARLYEKEAPLAYDLDVLFCLNAGEIAKDFYGITLKEESYLLNDKANEIMSHRFRLKKVGAFEQMFIDGKATESLRIKTPKENFLDIEYSAAIICGNLHFILYGVMEASSGLKSEYQKEFIFPLASFISKERNKITNTQGRSFFEFDLEKSGFKDSKDSEEAEEEVSRGYENKYIWIDPSVHFTDIWGNCLLKRDPQE